MADKFDECRECRNRRTEACTECDSGEQFEPVEERGLDFNDISFGGYEDDY